MAEAFFTTSWDDGHPLDFRVAELLQRNNLKGTFYIPRAAPTGVMQERQIRELAGDFEIGGHTLDHLFLPTIPDAQAKLQIVGCKDWVQDTIGVPCDMFCPPAGKFTPSHLDMIRGASFIGLRSVELLSLRHPIHLDGLVHMPTTLQAFPHHRLTYVKNAIKRKSWRNLWRYLILGGPAGWEGLAETLLRKVAATGGVFHLWGHSWELELASQWERLEHILHLMGQFVPHVRAVSNRELCLLTTNDAE